jgi:hypothetical protein
MGIEPQQHLQLAELHCPHVIKVPPPGSISCGESSEWCSFNPLIGLRKYDLNRCALCRHSTASCLQGLTVLPPGRANYLTAKETNQRLWLVSRRFAVLWGLYVLLFNSTVAHGHTQLCFDLLFETLFEPVAYSRFLWRRISRIGIILSCPLFEISIREIFCFCLFRYVACCVWDCVLCHWKATVWLNARVSHDSPNQIPSIPFCFVVFPWRLVANGHMTPLTWNQMTDQNRKYNYRFL